MREGVRRRDGVRCEKERKARDEEGGEDVPAPLHCRSTPYPVTPPHCQVRICILYQHQDRAVRGSYSPFVLALQRPHPVIRGCQLRGRFFLPLFWGTGRSDRIEDRNGVSIGLGTGTDQEWEPAIHVPCPAPAQLFSSIVPAKSTGLPRDSYLANELYKDIAQDNAIKRALKPER